MQIHASCVSIDHAGVLLLGDSGAGKSDLALRLIDRGAQLVADDRVDLAIETYGVWASSPPKLHGLLEVRGVGILSFPAANQVPLKLVVQLVRSAEDSDRLPPEDQHWLCDGVKIPLLYLAPTHPATVAKIWHGLHAMKHQRMVEGVGSKA